MCLKYRLLVCYDAVQVAAQAGFSVLSVLVWGNVDALGSLLSAQEHCSHATMCLTKLNAD